MDNNKEDELLKAYQQHAQQKHNSQQPCPNCGHCPTCGRGYWGQPYVVPYMPSYPSYPWSPPYITWMTT